MEPIECMNKCIYVLGLVFVQKEREREVERERQRNRERQRLRVVGYVIVRVKIVKIVRRGIRLNALARFMLRQETQLEFL
jgi:hypothetical protein